MKGDKHTVLFPTKNGYKLREKELDFCFLISGTTFRWKWECCSVRTNKITCQNQTSKTTFFLGKITSYVASKLERVKMCLSRKYILLRDQAFFKLQFFFPVVEQMTLVCVYLKKFSFSQIEQFCIFNKHLENLRGWKSNKFVVLKIDYIILYAVLAFGIPVVCWGLKKDTLFVH